MPFCKQNDVSDHIVRVSCIVSEKIPKHSKPYSERVFETEWLSAAIELLCPDKNKHTQQISFSRWTVTERIDDVANDIQFSLKDLAPKFVEFSIDLGKKTYSTNCSVDSIGPRTR